MGVREDLFAAILARLDTAVKGDLSPVLEADALAEARQLAEVADDGDPQAAYLLGWLHWFRYRGLPEGQDRQDRDAAVRMFTLCFIRGVGGLPEPLLPLLAEQAAPAAFALLKQAISTKDQALISATVSLWQRIVGAAPAGHPRRRDYLSDLGNALQARFEQTGALTDLDGAIQATRTAIEATPADDPDRARYLNNLGNALRARFEQTGALTDLEAAIQASQTAVDATAPAHPARAMRLNNLENALQAQFERTGELADLNAAIQAGQEAVAAAPADYPDRGVMLSNVGNALRIRFGQTGALADLNAAIQVGQDAVAAIPAGHLHRAATLSNLGIALLARFERTGESADLEAAIRATEAAAADHPNQVTNLFNLGEALGTRFRKTGALADREAAFSYYAQATKVDSAAPSIRIRAARSAAALVAESEPARAAGLLEAAVRLMGEVAPRQLDRSDQQYALGGLNGLAADAAALTLADNTGGSAANRQRAARALGLLEAGRTVLLSQALDTRSALTDLRHQHPELAARFTKLRDQLDQSEDTFNAATLPGSTLRAAPGQAAEERRRRAGDFTAVLKQIRALDGFGSFGLPPTTGELLAEAAPGPVVTFSISAYGSDALLLTEDDITSLKLPDLALGRLTEQISSFHTALQATAGPGTHLSDLIIAQEKLFEILEWLWDVAAEPALDALGYRQSPPPGASWPRVWWAPGGLLGLLPIHAAGHHMSPRSNQPPRTVMDRVISSWTPTIRALRYARQHTPAAATAKRALIVAMPVTPGLPGGELPNVPMEVTRIRAAVPDTILLAEPGDPRVSGSSGFPTRANVLRELPGCPIAHFACHGFSDPVDPSKSLLLLHDHDNAPLTIASLAPVDLGQAELAYLSACDTALTKTARLLEEAVHLTTAFQLAGFPNVIGTLWNIDDQLAVAVAGNFYTTLLTSQGTVDTSQAARALHHAVRAARDELPRTPSLWAAYLHAGT